MREGLTEGSPVRVICNPASGGGAYEPASLRAVLGDQWEVVRPYAHLLEYGVLVGLAAAAL